MERRDRIEQELGAAKKVLSAFEDLDQDQIERIIRWLQEVFNG